MASELNTRYTTPSKIYNQKLYKLTKLHDVYGGNETMREGTTKYLPKMVFENENDYAMRLKTLAIKNYLKDAITGYVGRIFSKPTTLGDDWKPEAKKWWEDIDLYGNKGDVFFKRVVANGIRDGISWVLVDMPVSNALTLADERSAGIRPYCRLYEALDVIFVQSDSRGRIIDFRAREKEYVADGMEQKEIKKIRRFTPGQCEVYNEEDDTLETFNITFPTEYGVPVVPYITDPEPRVNYSCESPMNDMADMIIRLWRSQAEQDNSLSVSRCPMLFAKGLNLEKLIVSAKSTIQTENENADMRWIEASGAALDAGNNDISAIIAEIEAQSLKPLQQADNTRTRYEAKSDDAKTTSPIVSMADAAQDMIGNALKYMALWTGNEDGGSVALNSNFDLVDYDASEMTTLMNMYANSMISKSTLLKEAKRRGILADDLDIEAELAAVSAQDTGINEGV